MSFGIFEVPLEVRVLGLGFVVLFYFKLKPRIIFSHLWIIGNQFGVVVRMTDAQLAGYDGDEDVVMVNPFERP